MLDFTATERHFDTTVSVELKHGGSHIDVTDANKREYVELRCASGHVASARHELTCRRQDEAPAHGQRQGPDFSPTVWLL